MFAYLMTIILLAGAASTALFLLSLCIGMILYILYALGAYRMFQKAGIAGWLAWIPLVNEYFVFKICWKTGYYWLYLASNILVSFNTTDGHMNWIACILWVAALMIHIIYTQHLARSFGQGTLFGAGLLLFESVFIMILGFGSSLYYGPQDRISI